MSKIKDGKLALAMMIGAIGAEIPNANKGFDNNDNLKKGEMNDEDLEKSARKILQHAEKKLREENNNE